MEITSAMVKSLRETTGLGMMDCKNALVETGGDMEQAVDLLRKKGLKVAEKRSGRETSQGIVESYIHTGGKIGVLVEIMCETDFVARTPGFIELAHDIAMQIAATNPLCVSREQLPADALAKEREIYEALAREEGKPEKIIPKIVDGKVERYFEAVCLLDQPYVKDQDKKVQEVITEKMAETGENIQIGRFTRFVLGEQ